MYVLLCVEDLCVKEIIKTNEMLSIFILIEVIFLYQFPPFLSIAYTNNFAHLDTEP